MAGEVGRCLRLAVLLQVGRRRAEDAPMLTELARHQPAVGQLANTDCGIEAFGDDIDKAFGVFGLKLYLGKRQGKLGEHRAQPQAAHGRGQGDAQPPANLRSALGCFAFGLADQARGLAQALYQPRAFIGETQLAGGSLDQANTQALLQCAKALGQHRGMALQQAPGSGKGALLEQRQEGGKLIGLATVERVHGGYLGGSGRQDDRAL
ncbi:hypothetical protein D3C76_1033610 [compost metagenome]